ncbi:muscle ankyrin repeat protein 3 [Capsaspora owczarzaki ATCC 30864]|uniref:Muscle ankyrin repeat protein 3 n=1 Tax=Capsaspora owczarzaki (strain ATCC 30864) TaxID=595528 RepID=A0A0D2U9K4_CAPO3|nr:muscle ankyrin repeat protein 3 [Capsaspora owczarzaki ATCC 30864]KJE91761.1 muscle ankyrin repeat protein 3 [Capsaspora owczarzaki ATCC 30864]|eukprot:XP_004348666.1 muscle ankyrin repeat protein 3 [Capsaspora owczarzaki ATCC 30864]
MMDYDLFDTVTPRSSFGGSPLNDSGELVDSPAAIAAQQQQQQTEPQQAAAAAAAAAAAGQATSASRIGDGSNPAIATATATHHSTGAGAQVAAAAATAAAAEVEAPDADADDRDESNATPYVIETAAPPTYDEDLVENAFFQTLKNKHRKLYTRAADKRHVILVPRSGTVAAAALTKELIESHVASPAMTSSSSSSSGSGSSSSTAISSSGNGSNAVTAPTAAPGTPTASTDGGPTNKHSQSSDSLVFDTANQRKIRIDNARRTVVTDAGFRTRIEATILFEESFYNTRDESFRVLCLSRPLLPVAGDGKSQNSASSGSSDTASALGAALQFQTYEECSNFLWSDPENTPTFFRITESISLFNASFQFMAHSLRHTIDAAHTIYTRGMQAMLTTRIGAQARSNTAMMTALKLSLETYILDGIYLKIFDGACSTFAHLDTSFNRKTRALLDLSDKDMDVPAELGLGISSAVANIARLNMVKTPLEKLHVLRKSIAAITATPAAGTKSASSPPLVLSTDDLLPILILIVIRSDIPNWHANLWYTQSFRFASNGTDAFAFTLASFQAAVEHIKSDEFARFATERLGLNIGTSHAGQGHASSGRNREIAELLGHADALPGTASEAVSADASSTTLQPPRNRAHSEIPGLWSSGGAGSVATSVATSPSTAAASGGGAAVSPARRTFSFSDALQPSSQQPNLKKKDNIDILVAHMLRGGRAAVESFFKKVNSNQLPEVRAILAAASLGRRASSMLQLNSIGADASTSPTHRVITREEVESTLCHPLCDCAKCQATLATVGRPHDAPDAPVDDDPIDLDSSITVYSRDGEGCTALHVAARLGHVDMVKTLIEFGAIVNAANYMGLTPLHSACQRNHLDVVKVLLSKGADLSLADHEGNTSLHFAALHGHLDCVKELVRNEARGVNALTHVVDVNMTNGRGNTALHLASKWGFIDIVQVLLRHGAMAALRNSRHETPLQCAQNKKIADLIRTETEDDPVSVEGFDEQVSAQQAAAFPTRPSTLTRSATSAMLKPAGLSSSAGFVSSPATAADGARNASTLRRTLTQPALSNDIRASLVPETLSEPANADPADTNTAVSEAQRRHEAEMESLFRAIDDDDIALFKFRLSIIDAEDGSGPTVRVAPTDAVLLMCHPLCQCDKCSMLQSQPSTVLDINSTFHDGITALHYASLHGHDDIVEVLVKCGAAVNMRNAHGHTPLHFACQYNHKVAVAKLLNASAKFNVKDRNGNTPLHFCAGNGHVECAELLLEKGASVNVPNKRGDTALHTASRWGFGSFVVLLLQHGASTTLQNERGQTPLQCAKSEQVMTLILNAAAQAKFAADAAVSSSSSSDSSFTADSSASSSASDALASIVQNSPAVLRPNVVREMTATGPSAAGGATDATFAATATTSGPPSPALATDRPRGSIPASPPVRAESSSPLRRGSSNAGGVPQFEQDLEPVPRRSRTESLITMRSHNRSPFNERLDDPLASSGSTLGGSFSSSSRSQSASFAEAPTSPSAAAASPSPLSTATTTTTPTTTTAAAASAATTPTFFRTNGFMPAMKGRPQQSAVTGVPSSTTEFVDLSSSATTAVAATAAIANTQSAPLLPLPPPPPTTLPGSGPAASPSMKSSQTRSRAASSTTSAAGVSFPALSPASSGIAEAASEAHPPPVQRQSSTGSSTRASNIGLGDIFNIMETSDLAQGHAQIMASIGNFNRTNLKRPKLTRDQSAPFIDGHLKLALSINKFDTARLKRTTTREKVLPALSNVPAELLGDAQDPQTTPKAFASTDDE